MKRTFLISCLLMGLLLFGLLACGKVTNTSGGETEPQGDLLWKRVMAPVYFAAPSIANSGKILIGTQGGIPWGQSASSSVLALNPNGSVAWETFLPIDTQVVSSVLQDNQEHGWFLLAGHPTNRSLNGRVEITPNRLVLIGLSPTGSIRVRSSIRPDHEFTFRPLQQSLDMVISKKGNVLFSISNALFCYGPTGAKLWRRVFGAAGAIVSAPIVGPKGQVLVTVKNFRNEMDAVLALDQGDGQQIWQWVSQNLIEELPLAPVMSDKSTLLIVKSGTNPWVMRRGLVALDVNQGVLQWSTTIEKGYLAAPPVINEKGQIYGVSAINGSEQKAYIYAFSKNGQILWNKQIDGSSQLKKWHPSAQIGGDGSLVTVFPENKVSVLNSQTGALEKTYDLAKLLNLVSDQLVQIYSAPAFGANGEIYIADYKSVFKCVQKKNCSYADALKTPEDVVQRGAVYAIRGFGTKKPGGFWPAYRRHSDRRGSVEE